ncbi:MAG TPA: hypothetical protein VFA98_00230 [Thermoanaerobaculia bacterium]|jgi:hypothetical protein|nr:hypothetical protein [Thermoanaerobaculia bacterium]
MTALGSPQIFFGRAAHWDEEDGWEAIEARDAEEAAAKFAEKWDLDDDEKLSVVKAEGGPHEFMAQKKLVVVRWRQEDEDDGPDSQR